MLLRQKESFGLMDVATFKQLQQELFGLLSKDCENIQQGVYPLSVLKPESPVAHLMRLPRVLWDGVRIGMRRHRGRTTEFSAAAGELLDELPRYYRRNFHFQSDGYLSEESAELYEHQVEILFNGSADAMRRLIIAPLRERFGSGDGKGLTFLEIGAGTGRTTRFVSQAFPKARIIATDLSTPYIKVAGRRLSAGYPKVDFLQADGSHLPFQNGQFDAVYSVFLFHELPLEQRREILAESRRVLKDGGFFGFVDSIQKGDKPVFDTLLEDFPKSFHEPFYRNYIENSMEGLLEEQGFAAVRKDTGFFSKVAWAIRPSEKS